MKELIIFESECSYFAKNIKQPCNCIPSNNLIQSSINWIWISTICFPSYLHLVRRCCSSLQLLVYGHLSRYFCIYIRRN